MNSNSGKQHPRECAVEGCERPHKAGGKCHMHYQREWARARYQRRMKPVPPVDEVVVSRLVAGERVPCNTRERALAVRRLVQRDTPKATAARIVGVHPRQVYRDLARLENPA